MESVKQWSTLICSSFITCILIEFLIPPGKISKIMNMVIGTFMICSIITPFSNKQNFFDFKFKKFDKKYNLESKTKFLDKVNDQMENIVQDSMSSIISGVLKDIEIKAKKIEIFMDKNEGDRMYIIKCRIYLDESYQEMKEIIKKEVKNRLQIETEVVYN